MVPGYSAILRTMAGLASRCPLGCQQLGQTFFAKLYCMLTDRFGVMWQLTLTT